jgi:NADPH:quinone reductase-like Zn-dependent oxidoreductase
MKLPVIPKFMRAAAIDRFGGPEVLTIHSLPVPSCDAREVLIALDTAGVGSWDAEMRRGWMPDGHADFPLVLGTDGAGSVAAVGSRVTRFKTGDLVYSFSFDNPKGGFYAEYVAVSAEKVAHTPESLDLEHAGAIPTTGLTALQGIDRALRTKKGQSVIIHGASGGVGTLAVQFARLRGARVLGTASHDALAFVERLGADAVVDGRKGDILAAARSFAPNGIDAVLGLAGGEKLERCIDALRAGGRVAYPSGVEPAPKKRGGIEIVSYDAVANVHEFDRLSRAVDAAHLQVPITAAYAFEDAAQAHQRIEARHVLGKIVLRVRNGANVR